MKPSMEHATEDARKKYLNADPKNHTVKKDQGGKGQGGGKAPLPDNAEERAVVFQKGMMAPIAGGKKVSPGSMVAHGQAIAEVVAKDKFKEVFEKTQKKAALIRQASSLPKGDPRRREILKGLR